MLGKHAKTADVPQNFDGSLRSDEMIRIRRERMPQYILAESNAAFALDPPPDVDGRGDNIVGRWQVSQWLNPRPQIVGQVC